MALIGMFGFGVGQDAKQSDRYAAHLRQGGLGLPDKDDYLDAAPERAAHRALYLTHVAAMLRLAGIDQPERRAARVLALETAIAATHASRADTDDVYKTDNEWHRAFRHRHAPDHRHGAHVVRCQPASRYF